MQTDSTIFLKAGNWQAKIEPKFGMNTLSLRKDGEEILRTPESIDEFNKKPEAYGIPPLLPPNRTANGSFVFNNKPYSLPITEPMRNNHLNGFLHTENFAVLKQSDTMVEAEYFNQKKIYPFAFKAIIKSALTNNGLHESFTIKNIGTEPMPLTFGIHTAFKAPSLIQVPIGKRWVTDDNYVATGEIVPLTKTEECILTGIDPRDIGLLGFYTASGHQARIGEIKYTMSDNFDGWVIWNQGGGKGFVCIEPQQGACNALNNGYGLILLDPNQSETFEIDITV